jgi:hypothetical protein
VSQWPSCLEGIKQLSRSLRGKIECELARRGEATGDEAGYRAGYRAGYQAGLAAGRAAGGAAGGEAVAACFRRLCLRYHPDRGGSTETMTALNELYQAVRQGAEAAR